MEDYNNLSENELIKKIESMANEIYSLQEILEYKKKQSSIKYKFGEIDFNEYLKFHRASADYSFNIDYEMILIDIDIDIQSELDKNYIFDLFKNIFENKNNITVLKRYSGICVQFNFYENSSIDDFCNLFNVSKLHLVDIFKKSTVNTYDFNKLNNIKEKLIDDLNLVFD